jgi:hypothetical protein
MKHMTEVNGKEVRVIERFGKKARVHVVETSAEFIVDTKHVRWAGALRVRDIHECKFVASLHSRAWVFPHAWIRMRVCRITCMWTRVSLHLLTTCFAYAHTQSPTSSKDKTRWDGKQDDSSKSFIQREHAKEEMKLAREREGVSLKDRESLRSESDTKRGGCLASMAVFAWRSDNSCMRLFACLEGVRACAYKRVGVSECVSVRIFACKGR